MSLSVIAHNIRSLYNVGSLFRLCDGVGVTTLYLTGYTGAPFDDVKHQRQYRQIAKTALEGLGSIRWEYYPDPLPLIAELKRQGTQIITLEQTAQSQNYLEAKIQFPACVILGHETDGVDPSLIQLSDLCLEIPMYGRGKSLNVISAASVVLYQLKTQQPDLSA